MIGGLLQSLVGFGLGLLCAPLIFLIKPELVPAPMILNALVITSLLSWKYRKYIEIKRSGISMLSATVGILMAAFVIQNLEQNQYQVLFGVLILSATALSIFGFKPKVTFIYNALASLFSGFMGTTTAAGGAPMGLLYQSEDKNKIKANLSIFFAYINLIGIITLLFTGAAGQTDIVLFLQTIPAVLIGWLLSKLISNRINEDIIRKLILTIALAAGTIMILSV